MFGFGKKRTVFKAVADGVVCSLSDVPDEVFASRMAGDGVAISVKGSTIVSPVAGTLTMIFPTKHAFAITTADGLEVLVHVGINTVTLGGEGFTVLAAVDTIVKAGTPILHIERPLLEARDLSLMTPILITNSDGYTITDIPLGTACVAGVTDVFQIRRK
ncbi:MAG: PTS sugar transporter subunit IIA [Bacilli bacterium]